MVSLYCNQSGTRMVYILSDKLGKYYGNKYRNKNAKPKNNDYSINVDAELSLLVKATGSKLW
jgi:hypothetical protein